MDAFFPADIYALVQAIQERAVAAGKRVACAESCTGGLLSAALTEVPGSSDFFDRGFVCYSNAAKSQSLGVSEDILDTFGAVSEAVAWAMAKGALDHSDADLAVAVTGIAGPGGGSERKPVGLVVFALAVRGSDPDQFFADMRQFESSHRDVIRLQAVRVALDLLKSALPAV